MTITLSMQLGLAPLPKKTARGAKHTTEGSLAAMQPSTTRQAAIARREATRQAAEHREAVRENAATRRAAILEALRDAPTTTLELAEETGASVDVINEDLKIMLAAEQAKKRKHKGENLYWVPA